MTPKLSLEDFPLIMDAVLDRRSEEEEDQWEWKALCGLARHVGIDAEPSTFGSTYARGQMSGPAKIGVAVVGVRNGTYQGQAAHQVRVAYALFEPGGKLRAWSNSLDPELPGKDELVFLSRNRSRVVRLSEAQIDKLSALRKNPQPAAPVVGEPTTAAAILKLSCSANGKLAAATADGYAALWAPPARQPAWRVSQGKNLSSLALDPAGRTVVTAASKLVVCDALTGEKSGALPGLKAHADVLDVQVSPDGARVAVLALEGLGVWDLAARAKRWWRPGVDEDGDDRGQMRWAPDGSAILWVRSTGRFLDARTGKMSSGHGLAQWSETEVLRLESATGEVIAKRALEYEHTRPCCAAGALLLGVTEIEVGFDLLDAVSLQTTKHIAMEHDGAVLAPDARTIYACAGRALMAVPVDGGSGPRKLADLPAGDVQAMALSPSGDDLFVAKSNRIFRFAAATGAKLAWEQ